MKIREIRAVGLHGATPEGGWSDELESEESAAEPDASERGKNQ